MELTSRVVSELSSLLVEEVYDAGTLSGLILGSFWAHFGLILGSECNSLSYRPLFRLYGKSFYLPPADSSRLKLHVMKQKLSHHHDNRDRDARVQPPTF